MNLPKNFSDHAVVLKRSNFGEADRLLTLFSHNFGKFSCVAKGVRKTTSKKAPHVELFSLCNFYFSRSSGLPLLIQAETIKPFSNLKSNLETTRLIFQAAEVLDRLLPEWEPQENVFADLQKLLTYLDSKEDLPKEKLSLILTRFQLKLLKELGFGSPHNDDPISVTNFIETLIDRRLIAGQTLK